MTIKDLDLIKKCVRDIETVDAINEIINHSFGYNFILKSCDGREVNISKIINNSYIVGNIINDIESIREEAIKKLSHFKCDLEDDTIGPPYFDEDDC